ncbi:GMC family oxidoreductase [Sorangium sp. So ce118]
MKSASTYHYIVVGGGATGCVLANRLSADRDTRVLLLESGDMDTDPRIHDIGGYVPLWGSEIDWKLSTEAQPAMSGRQIVINQGKVIGGSTAINAMMYVRGNRRNYDQWSALGNDGWSYDALLPYFKRSEDYEGGASEFHGAGGPLRVRDCPDPAARSEAFLVGATELGYDGPSWDYNGARQEDGAGLLQFTIDRDGRRSSAATAFLSPILGRPNLTVETRAEVTRLLFEGRRVIGVEYVQDGQRREVSVEREVIVSAGALLSPKLLLLSGIGPADHLRQHGVRPIVDLPGVGQNLQDHVQLPVVYQSRVARPMPTVLTGNALFVRTRTERGDAPPDLQLNFTPAVPSPLAPVLNLPVPVLIFLPILVQPDSTGEVKLRSGDPQDPPIINPNYLQRGADVQVFVQAIKLIRELASTKAFTELNGGELTPGPQADLEGFIRAQASTLWHPVGTCRMGRDARAVVDAQLRVHGTEGVRVADASVMPIIPSGNTAAACFMIGEKLADMILEDK